MQEKSNLGWCEDGLRGRLVQGKDGWNYPEERREVLFMKSSSSKTRSKVFGATSDLNQVNLHKIHGGHLKLHEKTHALNRVLRERCVHLQNLCADGTLPGELPLPHSMACCGEKRNQTGKCTNVTNCNKFPQSLQP